MGTARKRQTPPGVAKFTNCFGLFHFQYTALAEMRRPVSGGKDQCYPENMSEEADGKLPGGGFEEDRVAVNDPAEQLAAIVAERDQLAAEKAALQDLMLRRQADFDNYRRRAERERLESRENGRMDAIVEILPVVDDFERALKTESADKEYAKGIELIYV